MATRQQIRSKMTKTIANISLVATLAIGFTTFAIMSEANLEDDSEATTNWI